jgi:hypothetical protein
MITLEIYVAPTAREERTLCHKFYPELFFDILDDIYERRG